MNTSNTQQSNMTTLTEEQVADLQAIVEYLADSCGEAKDYYNREKDEKGTHIYARIMSIANAIGGQAKGLVDYYAKNYDEDEDDEEDEKCVGAEGAPPCEAIVKDGDTVCDECFKYVEAKEDPKVKLYKYMNGLK